MPPEPSEPAAPAARGALRVLLVEDCEDDALLLLRELAKGGWQPLADRVETPEAMEAALARQEWDLVVSDWVMPHFSAPAALELLRTKDADLPFIIVSGTVGEDVAVAAMRAGAHDFFNKSRLARLAPAVARELEEAELRRERKRMQEQLMVSDRMASVGILAAGVAHEINNPLSTVLANVDLALRDLAAARQQLPSALLADAAEELQDVREAAERIRSIVRDLRVFSRADSEQRGPVEVEKLLESTLRMAWTELRHRARVVKQYAPVPAVDASESRLGQVFLNLIVNAAQSIPEGRAERNQITLSTRADPEGWVVVEVRDTGAGIAPEAMKQLFTPFFTTKPAGAGTGLGLSICRRIVTALGGEISVESELGQGSAFRVRLPPAPVQAEPRRAAPAAEPSTGRRGAILVVDDDPLVGATVRRVLGRAHDVVVARSGQEALEIVAGGRRYDVIVCDLMMPQMTGMELHAELARRSPEQAERMIFLTGGAFTPSAREFLDRVEQPRLEKPFDLAAFRALVNERIG